MKTIMKRNGQLPVLNDAIEHLFNDSFFRLPERVFNGNLNNFPAVNILENHDGYALEMAAPGMKKDDFKIELKDGTITISSEVSNESEEKENSYTRKEFSFTSFRRSFQLPENTVDEANIKATYENGVLMVNIPKREEAKPEPARMIEIS